ncbi:uncharacterized protein GGS25DRAFT_60584 [Hypoxylon fragiforme]|uniref:uncharacterized protein n=1 Tax=Hypoxylon fragiforme TaxID=63214 RepID=UPI0020C73D30|nr:uncharacterized protein GGS25DRAFT_60584 [Hypoxylon fragiforme]KAI2614660.1 hypothetical protein GGS25DRAFT_60584 [Hypoxylon fragiforme]
MCLFHHTTPKPKKNKKARTTTTKEPGIEEFEHLAGDEAINQGFSPTSFGNPTMHYPYGSYAPWSMEQWLRDNEPCNITRNQWASHHNTVKATSATVNENGQKIDAVNASVSGGIAEARNTAKHTQDAINAAIDVAKGTHMAVEDVHATVKATYDAIKKNHGEHARKQDRCAAEISKVRKMMEEEAARREEAHQKQQNMQEAWNYYQWFRQAERDAEPRKSSGSSIRTQSSSSSKPSRRRQAPSSDDPAESEKRQHQDEELKRAVWNHLKEFFGEATPQARHVEGNRDNHNHFYTYLPPSPSWGGRFDEGIHDDWQDPFPPFRRHHRFHDGSVDDGFRVHIPPQRQDNPFMHQVSPAGRHGHRRGPRF